MPKNGIRSSYVGLCGTRVTGPRQNVPDFVLVIRTLILFYSIFTHLISKYVSAPEMYLLLLTYFNLHYIKSFWYILTFTSGKELFWRVYVINWPEVCRNYLVKALSHECRIGQSMRNEWRWTHEKQMIRRWQRRKITRTNNAKYLMMSVQLNAFSTDINGCQNIALVSHCSYSCVGLCDTRVTGP